MSKIVVCHCNRPDFLKIQLESFTKTCEDLEEIIVVNDGSSLQLRQEINLACHNNRKVRLINAPLDLDHSSAPVACSAVLQWIYDQLLNEGEQGNVAFLDSDMFPLNSFKISDFLPENISISALKQTRGNVDYIWNGIVMINFSKLKSPRAFNWSCGVVKCENVDCGGLMHEYFERYGREQVNYITHTSHMSMDQVKSLKNISKELSEKYNVDYRMEVFEDLFLHYGRASNWEHSWLSPIDFNQNKTSFMIEWLKNNKVIS
jgi:glycosyltransferase involved in cell wall biosynthesis